MHVTAHRAGGPRSAEVPGSQFVANWRAWLLSGSALMGEPPRSCNDLSEADISPNKKTPRQAAAFEISG